MAKRQAQLPAATASNGRYKYELIASRLRADIAAGKIRPDEALPGQAQLRQKFGVALSTIRQALAELGKEGLIRPEHGRGFFVCDPAKGRPRGRSAAPHQRIGFWLWDEVSQDEPWAMSILRGASALLSENNCDLSFGAFDIRDAQHAQRLMDFSARYDGLIVTGWVDGALLQQLLGGRQRVVLASHTTQEAGAEFFPCVREHVEAGAALAVQMLLMQGHRKLGVAGKQGTTCFGGWLRGAADACRQAGVAEPVVLPMPQPDAELRIARELAQRRDVTGVLVMGDVPACRIIRHLGELGVRVPEEKSFVASGSQPRAELPVLELSRIFWDAERIGHEAAKLLLSPEPTLAHHWIPCRVELGATIGPPQ